MKKHIDYILKGSMFVVIMACFSFIVTLIVAWLEEFVNPILPLVYIPSLIVLVMYCAGYVYTKLTDDYEDD